MFLLRTAEIERKTFETNIKCHINIDGKGENNIDTGIGFFDHMLTHVSKHGFMDMELKAEGDLHVDCHHTVEDVGIVLGKAITQALGDKKFFKHLRIHCAYFFCFKTCIKSQKRSSRNI